MVKPYIASKLISWQKQAGRHNLPWQKTNDAYQIWISEMMLQQTQVKTVIPYFNKFIQTFPNINRLADAQEDEVMEHWSGLGYYRRAKFIMQSAKIVVEKYHSRFPMKVEDLMTLPGIGRSTAGAICALAFKNPAPILDANVVRVFCRFYGIKEYAGVSTIKNKLWELAERNLPSKDISIYTQALMDLGATICKVNSPSCKDCPIKKKCESHKRNWIDHIPAKKPKKKIPTRDVYALVVEKGEYILLEKRIRSSVWEGLWSLPEIHKDCQPQKWVKDFLGEEVYIGLRKGSTLATFSHYKMRLFFEHIQIHKPINKVINEKFKWVDKEEIKHIALPTPIKKLLEGI